MQSRSRSPRSRYTSPVQVGKVERRQSPAQSPPTPPAPPPRPSVNASSAVTIASSSTEQLPALVSPPMANTNLYKVPKSFDSSDPAYHDVRTKWNMQLPKRVPRTNFSLRNDTAGLQWHELSLGHYCAPRDGNEDDDCPLNSFLARKAMSGIRQLILVNNN